MKKLGLMALGVVLCVWAFAAKAKFDTHVVKKGETLYSISHAYGLKVKDLIAANPALKDNSNIKPGQEIKVPGNKPQATLPLIAEKPVPIRQKPTVNVPSTPDAPYTDEENKKRNVAVEKSMATTDNTVPAETVTKPMFTVAEAPFSIRATTSNPADYAALFEQYRPHGYKVVANRGAASYLADNTSGNPNLALYNGAETGTVIKVTNMMNKHTIYVKVVGRVAPSDMAQDIILKLSNKAATQLGVLDEKFVVEVEGIASN